MKDGLRCLTLHEPWATLVANGVKKIETRSWSTSYRGPIGIHAALHLRDEYRELSRTGPFLEELGVAPQFYLGCVIAVGYLSACFTLKDTSKYLLLSGKEVAIRPRERYFGDFTPGRFGWLIENVQRVHPPYPARGYQGLWTVARPNEALQEAMVHAHLHAARS